MSLSPPQSTREKSLSPRQSPTREMLPPARRTPTLSQSHSQSQSPPSKSKSKNSFLHSETTGQFSMRKSVLVIMILVLCIYNMMWSWSRSLHITMEIVVASTAPMLDSPPPPPPATITETAAITVQQQSSSLSDLDENENTSTGRTTTNTNTNSSSSSTSVATGFEVPSATVRVNNGNGNSNSNSSSNNNEKVTVTTTQNKTSLKVWIARTLSKGDIDNTIKDILGLDDIINNNNSNKDDKNVIQIQIEWTLFCYQSETYELLQDRLKQEETQLTNNNIIPHIYLSENRLKLYFWENYLQPSNIPNDVDYLWLIDGDISIRGMAWNCFWSTVIKYQPAISQPAILQPNFHWTDAWWTKWWSGIRHPNKCETKEYKRPPIKRRLHKLEATEVSVVEIQLPLLTRQAWNIVHNMITSRYPGWGNATTSDSGPDTVWCKMIDQELYGISPQDRETLQQTTKANWNSTQKTCTFENITTSTTTSEGGDGISSSSSSSSLPISCMVIHSTPVQHLDTQTLKKNASLDTQDFRYYASLFPEFGFDEDFAHEYIYNPRFSSYQCQGCKHFDCYNKFDNNDAAAAAAAVASSTSSGGPKQETKHKHIIKVKQQRHEPYRVSPPWPSLVHGSGRKESNATTTNIIAADIIGQDTAVVVNRTITYKFPKARMKQPTDIIIGILSTATNHRSRTSIRETWGKNSSLLFVIAGNWTSTLQDEMEQHQDLLWLDRPETYHGLPYKTLTLLHVAGKHSPQFRYVYKTDDDVYLRLDEFERHAKYFGYPDYMGRGGNRVIERDPNSEWGKYAVPYSLYPEEQLPKYNIGAGYGLSMKVLKSDCFSQRIANISFLPLEDALVGWIASKCDIEPMYYHWDFYDNPWIFQYWGDWKKHMESLHASWKKEHEIVNIYEVKEPRIMHRHHSQYCLAHKESWNCQGYQISVNCGGYVTASSCDKCPVINDKVDMGRCGGDCHHCQFGTETPKDNFEDVIRNIKGWEENDRFRKQKERCVPTTSVCRSRQEFIQIRFPSDANK